MPAHLHVQRRQVVDANPKALAGSHDGRRQTVLVDSELAFVSRYNQRQGRSTAGACNAARTYRSPACTYRYSGGGSRARAGCRRRRRRWQLSGQGSRLHFGRAPAPSRRRCRRQRRDREPRAHFVGSLAGERSCRPRVPIAAFVAVDRARAGNRRGGSGGEGRLPSRRQALLRTRGSVQDPRCQLGARVVLETAARPARVRARPFGGLARRGWTPPGPDAGLPRQRWA